MTVIEWLETGIGIIIEGAILVSLIGILSVFTLLNQSMAFSEQSSKKMEKYTEFNQYDNTQDRKSVV